MVISCSMRAAPKRRRYARLTSPPMLRAGGRADRIDSGSELAGEMLDAGKRRPVVDRVHRSQASSREIATQGEPDAIVDSDAVHQQQRPSPGSRDRIGDQ